MTRLFLLMLICRAIKRRTVSLQPKVGFLRLVLDAYMPCKCLSRLFCY